MWMKPSPSKVCCKVRQAPSSATVPVTQSAPLQLTPTGDLTFSSGWIFIPAPMAMAMVEDDDFLTFGYWTEIPAEADGVWTFTPFSSGSMPYTDEQRW